MKNFKLLPLLLLLLTGVAYGQQDAQFSHYMFNGIFYNPGYAGLENVTRFSLISRKQWLGYEASSINGAEVGGGSPTTQILTVSTPLPFFNRKSGAGAYLLYDTKGPLTSIEAQLSGSYHLKLGDGLLGLGLRAGLYSQRINGEWYHVVHPSDPIYQELIDNRASQGKLDLAAGAWYKTTKYYAGVSFSHLPQSRFTFGFDSITSKLSNHLYVTGGYNFKLGYSLVITPSILVQTDLNELTYIFGPMATYNDKFWGGINLRQSFAEREVSKGGRTLSNDDVVFLIGMNLLKNNALRVGYAFDFVTSGVQAKKRTSHEIMLSYTVPAPWDVPKPKVRTPRYRHDEN